MGVSRITLLKMATCFTCQLMIRGYHVYKHIWEAEDGETLNCVRETTNRYEPFSVAVILIFANYRGTTKFMKINPLQKFQHLRYLSGLTNSWSKC